MDHVPHIDEERIGHDSNAHPDLFAERIGAMARRLKDRPAKLQAFIAGLGHQGILARPAIASALAPFLRLPPPEPRTHKRARMAKVIHDCVAATGSVTRDEIAAAGFSDAEIGELFREALRASGVQRMAA
ncbi:hypothetical protein [uncultured Reyranella sp.]|jgi:hypothetical protein|uniref:hypothetical protein n=1 Tax=uncultured Reyranella sp. TaxID=735512 RepID=UPI00259CAF48|nr:hypothetical protein [uncultured Reyranella sp.]